MNLGPKTDMKIIPLTNIYAIEVRDTPGLDPFRVILQDIAEGQGRIILGCYGQAWECYWPAMGERSVSKFFRDCEPEYLAERLHHGKPMTKAERAYFLRIIVAVQLALAMDSHGDGLCVLCKDGEVVKFRCKKCGYLGTPTPIAP